MRSMSLPSTAIALLSIAASGAAQAPAPAVPAPDAQEIETSLFFIGDAGHADRPDHPVVSALREAAGGNSARSQLLFLGDNAYPEGLPEKDAPGRAAAELRLNTQVDAARASGAATIFIPGNHDWGHTRSEGWDQVRREARYVVERGGQNVRFLPEDGCPGPVTVDVGRSVRLVLLDTQWWLHESAEAVHPTSACSADSEDEVLGALRDAVRGATGRHVFVAGHHPLASGGPHGGSGSGSYDHNNAVRRLDITRYASDKPGLMRVDVFGDGRLRLRVLLVDARGRRTEAFAMWLD